MEKKSKEQIMSEMNSAASEAEKDLTNLSPEAVQSVAGWIKKWYMKAGYKRLGRILVNKVK